MTFRKYLQVLFASILQGVEKACAQDGELTSDGARLVVSDWFAGGLNWGDILTHVGETLQITIYTVATAAFIIVALMFTAGFINEEYKSGGKKLMISALIGMAVTISAKGIFDVAYFFVYG